MSKLVQPKLRFNNYKNSWAHESLKNILNISKKKYNPKILSENYKCIELENIESGTGRILGFKQSINQSSIKNYFQDGDVLYGKLRPYLKKFYKANFTGVCSSEIWVLKSNSLQGNFLYQFIQTYKFNDVANISSGSRMPRADWSYMSEVYFNIPESEEQEKIASFLSSVDKKIELLSKKHELLEKYKKGLMQKIFSQEIRFKQDDGSDFPDWVEATLGAIGKFSTSSVDKLTVEGQKLVKLFNYMNVYNHEQIDNKNKKCLMTVSAKDQQINSSNLKKGDILFTPSSETPIDIGHSVVIKEDLDNVLFSYHVVRFRPSINLDLIFENYFCNFTNILRQFSKFSQGATRYTLSIGLFSKVLIKYPSFDEQKKIGLLLSSVDKKIELAKQQIEKTQTFKKGLLQQMFV